MNTPITRLLNPLLSFEVGKRFALISKDPVNERTTAHSVYTIVYEEYNTDTRSVSGYNKSFGGEMEADLLQAQYWWYKVHEDFPFYNGRKLILNI